MKKENVKMNNNFFKQEMNRLEIYCPVFPEILMGSGKCEACIHFKERLQDAIVCELPNQKIKAIMDGRKKKHG